MLKLLPVFFPRNRVSQAAAGGMTRSNPVVSRKTFLAVARGFLLEEREEAYFRIDWAKTMTDPHFLRQADRIIFVKRFQFGPGAEEQRTKLDANLTAVGPFDED